MKEINLKILLLIILTLTLQAQAPGARSARIDVNSATQEELETLPGIGAIRARMIIRIREANGGFKTIGELRAIPQLTDKQFDRLRPRVRVGASLERERGSRPARTLKRLARASVY